ncbi:hypothetical protein NQZ68_033945 [Dissostichus eleginoides]|nr:hypothetical protein NQZ68_033945 [Dissostichus eleginoides]
MQDRTAQMVSQWQASLWTDRHTWESDHLVLWVVWGWGWGWRGSGTTCSSSSSSCSLRTRPASGKTPTPSAVSLASVEQDPTLCGMKTKHKRNTVGTDGDTGRVNKHLSSLMTLEDLSASGHKLHLSGFISCDPTDLLSELQKPRVDILTPAELPPLLKQADRKLMSVFTEAFFQNAPTNGFPRG